MDNDHALAQSDDVCHVVARQQHRRTVAAVVLRDERANSLLHRDVETDRRLVEEQDAWPMEQRADDLDLHPLAERQVTHRLAHEILDVEQCDQLVSHCKEVFAPQAVDGTVQFEGVERRKIPLELVAVAHHECHLAQVVALPPPRHVAEDVRLARGGMQQARQHLQGGRLAGPMSKEIESTARTSRHRRRTTLRSAAARPPSRSGTLKTLVRSET